ncbi:carbohydrate kinase family protein [uncultured Thermanaerothrix sp.]|uniref:carbohydrate kinase family protein n=1 Tax=uncultured Thermanaerothrix sp. TaxID=1195149 RepID=UPI00260C18FD|nr:carbohydrate kinase family protein [uncultured Thermanaerothrix sp.]
MKTICTGSIAYDYLMTFPGHFREHIVPEHLESLSLSFLVDSMVRQRGGVATNIAYTMALLGARPIVFGTVGEDFGEYRQFLESVGVDTRYIRVVPGVFTASFFANTDLDNNQICSFYPGAMTFARDLSLNELRDDQPELVIISPNDPVAMDRYVAECKAMGWRYIYDPSQQVVRVSGEELRRGVEGAFGLFVNEYEFELLQKHTGLSAASICNQVPLVVVTLGAKGAIIYTEGQELRIRAVSPRHIADPTGVGDAFRAGFIRGLQLGLDWVTCGQMGALAAAYCLEQKGPQSHVFTREEFVQRYHQNFGDCGALSILLEDSINIFSED